MDKAPRKEWYFLIGFGMLCGAVVLPLMGGTGYGYLDLILLTVLLIGGLLFVGKS